MMTSYMQRMEAQEQRRQALEDAQSQAALKDITSSLLASLEDDMDIRQVVLSSPQCCNSGCFDWTIQTEYIYQMLGSRKCLRSTPFYSSQGGACCRLLMWCDPSRPQCVRLAVEVTEGGYDAIVFRRGNVILTFNLQLYHPTAPYRECRQGRLLKGMYCQPNQECSVSFTNVDVLADICKSGCDSVCVSCSWDPRMLDNQ